MTDYYKILEVNREASQDEIRKAFRNLSLKYHPDRQVGKSEKEKKEAEEKFKEISAAYDVLSDPDKKREYDNTENFDNNFFSWNPFSDFKSSFFRSSPSILKGKSINIKVSITLEDIYFHRTKTVKFYRDVPCTHCNGTGIESNGKYESCPHCNGTGQYIRTERNGFTMFQQITMCPYCKGTGKHISNPCSYCSGTGVEKHQESIDITIDNIYQSNKIEGKGNYPSGVENQKIFGDLFIEFSVLEHPIFEIIEGTYDLAMLLEVPVLDCITGTKMNFKFIDNTIHTIQIDPGTHDGQVYTINGLGLKKSSSLKIYIKMKMPNKNLKKDELGLIEKLKTCNSFK